MITRAWVRREERCDVATLSFDVPFEGAEHLACYPVVRQHVFPAQGVGKDIDRCSAAEKRHCTVVTADESFFVALRDHLNRLFPG